MSLLTTCVIEKSVEAVLVRGLTSVQPLVEAIVAHSRNSAAPALTPAASYVVTKVRQRTDTSERLWCVLRCAGSRRTARR